MLALCYMYRTRYSKSFVATLALLPAVVCVVIMMVNGNVGAGVAVAGAFSLVRFRSVPGSAKEIGAIFLAMGAGLIVGMGYLAYAFLFSAVLGALLLLSGCGAQAQETANENQAASATDGASESASAADSAARQDEMFTSQDLDASYDAQPAAQIALSGESAAATGGAVEISGGTIRITGEGTLIIDAAAGHGVVCKDDLILGGGSYNITSASHGLCGKDSVRIAGGSFVIDSGKDAIQAENEDDADLGYLYILDGAFTLNAQGDGMSASSQAIIQGGTFTIQSGQGAGFPPDDSDAASAKGIKAVTGLTINGGNDRKSGRGGEWG